MEVACEAKVNAKCRGALSYWGSGPKVCYHCEEQIKAEKLAAEIKRVEALECKANVIHWGTVKTERYVQEAWGDRSYMSVLLHTNLPLKEAMERAVKALYRKYNYRGYYQGLHLEMLGPNLGKLHWENYYSIGD